MIQMTPNGVEVGSLFEFIDKVDGILNGTAVVKFS